MVKPRARRGIGWTSLCILLVIAAFSFALRQFATASAPRTTTAPAGPPSEEESPPDVVAAFYRCLEDHTPATRQEEEELFLPRSAIRYRLVLGDPKEPLRDVDPFKQSTAELRQRDEDDAKVSRAGPVVLEYFRLHKSWFLPTHMRSLGEIQISSLFSFPRTPLRIKGPGASQPDNGWVMAYFVRNSAGPAASPRIGTVVFRIVNGKIDPDYIKLDGIESDDTTLSRFNKELEKNNGKTGDGNPKRG